MAFMSEIQVITAHRYLNSPALLAKLAAKCRRVDAHGNPQFDPVTPEQLAEVIRKKLDGREPAAVELSALTAELNKPKHLIPLVTGGLTK
jgi:hypothetical protein